MKELLEFILSSPYNLLGTVLLIFTLSISLTSIVRSFRLFEINKIEIKEDEVGLNSIEELKKQISSLIPSNKTK
jgi:hypothetical protein